MEQKMKPQNLSRYRTLVFSSMMGILLSACSTTSETFDCKEGKGVGCKSISEVNRMVDTGQLGRDSQAGSQEFNMSTPVVTTAATSETALSSPSDDLVVHRIREEHLRVWMAPFQDEQGNLHEGTVIHTVLKPGFWHIRGGE